MWDVRAFEKQGLLQPPEQKAQTQTHLNLNTEGNVLHLSIQKRAMVLQVQNQQV